MRRRLLGAGILAALAALVPLAIAAHYWSVWYAVPAAAIWLAATLFMKPITPGKDAFFGLLVGVLCLLRGQRDMAYVVVACIALLGAAVAFCRLMRRMA